MSPRSLYQYLLIAVAVGDPITSSIAAMNVI